MHHAFRVLLVEDDELLREAVKTVLEKAGHLVFTAAAAKEAMHLILSIALDAVVSDVHLLQGSGFDVAAYAQRVAPRLPIVLMSAEDLSLQEQNSSIKLFLHKPTPPSRIVAALECLIGRDSSPVPGA